VITGANSGLGLHLAKALYRSGRFTHLVLACRSKEKGAQGVEEVKQQPHAAEVDVQCLQLDLSNRDSIRSFASELSSLYPTGSLHLLVNNAGIMGHKLEFTKPDGVEIHFATNHLGHFLLTNLLLPGMMAEKGRILVVTSGFYEKCKHLPTVEDITDKGQHHRSPDEYYSWSKLANCLHTVGLARRLKEQGREGVKVIAVRPGFVRGTDLGRYRNWILRTLAAPLIWLVARSLDEGIAGLYHCAVTEDEGVLSSGELYHDQEVEEYKGGLVTEAGADEMWALSEKLLAQGLE